MVPAIRAILGAIVSLADNVPEVLEVSGNATLVKSIVPSRTEQRLYANSKNWLTTNINSAIAKDSSLTTSHVVSAFTRVLATIDSGAFSDVCRVKWRDQQKKITPALQKGLMYDAALAKNQFELVRKYTIVTLGYNLWQPESKVKALDVEVFQPIPVQFRDRHRKRICHYRPADQVFKWSLNKKLADKSVGVFSFNGQSDLKRLSECHILFGGDHGQGAF